jgi:hypothetical protein
MKDELSRTYAINPDAQAAVDAERADMESRHAVLRRLCRAAWDRMATMEADDPERFRLQQVVDEAMAELQLLGVKLDLLSDRKGGAS